MSRGCDELRELARVRGQRPLVDLALGVAERTAVAVEAMQAVMDPLRDLEELRLPGDHRPARVDAGAAAVAEQRPQHLDDAAALRGRVDIPDHSAVQLPRGLLDQAEPALHTHPAKAPMRTAPAPSRARTRVEAQAWLLHLFSSEHIPAPEHQPGSVIAASGMSTSMNPTGGPP